MLTPANYGTLEDKVGVVGLEDDYQSQVHVEGFHGHPAHGRQQKVMQKHRYSLGVEMKDVFLNEY